MPKHGVLVASKAIRDVKPIAVAVLLGPEGPDGRDTCEGPREVPQHEACTDLSCVILLADHRPSTFFHQPRFDLILKSQILMKEHLSTVKSGVAK